MSQVDAILDHLRTGATITPAEALELCGSLALHSRIAELRAMGYHPQKQMRAGNGHRWGEYSLPIEECAIAHG